MAEFDPDAFLKGDTPVAAPAFDPDAFLKGDNAPPVDPSKAREEELRKKYRERLMPTGGEQPGYGERFLDNLTYGITRPLGGLAVGVQGLVNPTDNSTFGERYRAANKAAEDYYNKAEENTPGWGGTAAGFAGSVLAPFPMGKVKAAGTAVEEGGRALLAKLFAHGATQGAIEGAARNSEDVGSAVKGAVTGGVVGGATSAAVGGALKAVPGVGKAIKGAEEEANIAARGKTPEMLKEAAKTGFEKLDNAGMGYADKQSKQIVNGVNDLIATNQYDKLAHSKISGYVDDLVKKASQPQGMKFTELSNLRSALATEARGPDESTRTAARKVIGLIDDMVQKNDPAINPNNVDVKTIYPQARALWRSAALADDVGWTVNKAERKAATKSGVNPDQSVRDAFRKIQDKIEKPGAYSEYGPKGSDQRKLLADIIQGGKLQNTYSNIGAVAGSPVTRAVVGVGSGAAGLHGLVGPVMSGLGIGGAAVGGGVKNYFDRLAAKEGAENVNALIRDITGSKPQMASEMAQRILLAKQLAKSTGARVGGSQVNFNPPERLRVTRDAINQ